MMTGIFKKETGLFLASIILGLGGIVSVAHKLATLYLPLPLGDVPIPLLLWLGVIVYGLIGSRLLSRRILDRSVLSALFLVGFAVHIFMLLVLLKIDVVSSAVRFQSVTYKLYFSLYFMIASVAVSVYAGSGIADMISRRNNYNASIVRTFGLWPALFLFSYSVYSLFHAGIYGEAALMASVFFCSWLAWFQKEKRDQVLFWIRRVFQFVMQENTYPIAIFVGAVAIRIFYLTRIMSNPNYLQTGADGVFLDSLAWNFAAHGTVDQVFRNGYWIFLGLVYKIFGRDYFIACSLQSIMGALSCVLVYLLAKQLFGNVVARIASFVALLDFSMIFSCIGICHEFIDSFYMLSIIVLISRYLTRMDQKHSITYMIAVGILFGLAVAAREYTVAFIPLVLLWLFVVAARRKKTSRALVGIAMIIIFTAVSLGPFLYLTYKNLGAVFFPATQGGASGGYSLSDYLSRNAGMKIDPEMAALGLGTFEQDVKNAIPVIFEKGLPACITIMKCYLKGFLTIFFNCEYGSFDPIFLIRNSAFFYDLWLYAYLFTFFGIFFSLFSRGIVRDKSVIYLILLLIGYRTAIHILFYHPFFRYRAPLEPFLILFGAFGLWRAFHSAAKERIKIG